MAWTQKVQVEPVYINVDVGSMKNAMARTSITKDWEKQNNHIDHMNQNLGRKEGNRIEKWKKNKNKN
jgi:hypothetical protein